MPERTTAGRDPPERSCYGKVIDSSPFRNALFLLSGSKRTNFVCEVSK